jgi:hypothetical protein
MQFTTQIILLFNYLYAITNIKTEPNIRYKASNVHSPDSGVACGNSAWTQDYTAYNNKRTAFSILQDLN